MSAAPDEPTVARRVRLAPDERRAQLVALGVAALAEHPLQEIDLAALAAQAGVSKGLVFHYFESKQGFQREIVRTARDSMLRATEPREDLPPLERLHDTLLRTVGFVREHRGTFVSLVRGTASGDPRIQEVVEQARKAQAARVVALLAECDVQASPELRIAIRAWIAFAEQLLVDAAHGADRPAERIVELAEGALEGVVRFVDEPAAAALFDA
ncbi:TetR/AcrR family transcriptional regulator [Agromyces sp. MMS24-JH15]|uniref:TetR/AcrR family transcriptional regulator n=1 Tax=Agromyces sp. MMS24-JH15 TaxID=3243765 RepID=UPI00374889FF